VEALQALPGVAAAVRHLPAEGAVASAAEVAVDSVEAAVVVASVVAAAVDGAPTSH
jgi:hypothetical protein